MGGGWWVVGGMFKTTVKVIFLTSHSIRTLRSNCYNLNYDVFSRGILGKTLQHLCIRGFNKFVFVFSRNRPFMLWL